MPFRAPPAELASPPQHEVDTAWPCLGAAYEIRAGRYEPKRTAIRLGGVERGCQPSGRFGDPDNTSQNAHFALSFRSREVTRVRNIRKFNVDLVQRSYLKRPLNETCGHGRYIGPASMILQLSAIKTAHGVVECTDETLIDALSLEHGQIRVIWNCLCSVGKLESTNSELKSSAVVLYSHERLP